MTHEILSQKEEQSFFGFFLKNYRFTYLLVIGIILFGFFTLFTMPREADPEIKVPYASITTVYPGASGEDIEELVTNKIEDKIKNLENINKFSSGSSQGVSSIFVEFEADADIGSSMQKLRDAVNVAKSDLPSDAEDPRVSEINISDFPIVTYSISGDVKLDELKQYADEIKKKFEGIKDVSRVNILGAPDREIQIIANEEALNAYGLSLNDIANAVRYSNINAPLGQITIGQLNYQTRAVGRSASADEIQNILITSNTGQTVKIRDVAKVQNGFAEQKTISKIGDADNAVSETISLQLYKRTGGNILNIVDESQEILEQIEKDGQIPQSVKITKTNDNAVYIKQNLSTLGTSGLQTMALIVVILFAAIGFKPAIITSLSVPIAFLSAFIFLYFFGMTLNGMVLFSLVLSLGLMVDNSIIVIEGIKEYSQKHNHSLYKAALLSVNNYKWPIIAGTMTTVAAFLPMLLVSGIMGEYLSIMPITISSTLISSLFVALIVIPVFSYRFLHRIGSDNEHNIFEKLFKRAGEIYEKNVGKILETKTSRRLVLIIAWVAFAVAVAIPFSGNLRVEMFPKTDMDYFVVNIELPNGSDLDETELKADQAARIVQNIPELQNFVANIGTAASIGLTASQGGDGSHLANITVNLVEKDLRERKSWEIAEEARQKITKDIMGAKITVEEISAGPPSGSPLEVRVFGYDKTQNNKTAEKIASLMGQADGVINVKTSIKQSPGDLAVVFDKEKMSLHGLNMAQTTGILRSALYGVEADSVLENGEDTKIWVKYADSRFSGVEDLKNFLIKTPSGQTVPVKDIAQVELKNALSGIAHKEGKPLETISADLKTGADLAAITGELKQKINNAGFSDVVSVEIGGETEDIDKSFKETFMSMIVAVILIAIILVLVFNSFRQPLIIIFTLPLAIIGVIFGLLILGMPFSFTTFIGIVALAGIVVNDAIVLIDRANKNVARGMDGVAAILEAGKARIQPIFLTTLTTIAGITPLIWADELWRGFSIAVIFGLAFATILTLVIVPVMYANYYIRKSESD